MLIIKKVSWKGGANSKNLGLGGIIVIIEFCLILMIEAVSPRERKRPVLGYSMNLCQSSV